MTSRWCGCFLSNEPILYAANFVTFWTAGWYSGVLRYLVIMVIA